MSTSGSSHWLRAVAAGWSASLVLGTVLSAQAASMPQAGNAADHYRSAVAALRTAYETPGDDMVELYGKAEDQLQECLRLAGVSGQPR